MPGAHRPVSSRLSRHLGEPGFSRDFFLADQIELCIDPGDVAHAIDFDVSAVRADLGKKSRLI